MPELFDVLNSQAIELLNNIRINLGRTGTNATNKTSHSLRQETKQQGTKFTTTVYGRAFFRTVDTGRRPTPDKKPSQQMIENLEEWMEARGMDSRQVWGIAMNIQKRGTALWRAGGREEILPPAVDQYINDVSQAFLQAEAANFIFKLREMKWSQ